MVSDRHGYVYVADSTVDAKAITRDITTSFAGVDVVVASAENGAPRIAWGDTFFIYDPDRNLDDTRRFPFATIVTKDLRGFRQRVES